VDDPGLYNPGLANKQNLRNATVCASLVIANPTPTVIMPDGFATSLLVLAPGRRLWCKNYQVQLRRVQSSNSANPSSKVTFGSQPKVDRAAEMSQ
jgi:hypothetical protein